MSVFLFVLFLLASIGDLAELLKNEPQDEFILGLQDTLSTIFSSPTIFSLAYVRERKRNPKHFTILIYFRLVS